MFYYLFHHKTPKSSIQIRFHQFTNKYNFIKSTLIYTNYTFIQQIFKGKNYKTSKHQNKIHILQNYIVKINILKLSSNKKWIVLLT